MKTFLLAALGSLTLLAGAQSATAQDRGYRGGGDNRGYGYNNNGGRYDNDRDDDGIHDRWDDNDDRRYRDYGSGNWQARNGEYWNGRRHISTAEYLRWRRYQQYRRNRGRNQADWAYEQGVRDGRRQARRGGNCNNGRW